MNKKTVLKIVNIFLFLVFLVQSFTGIFHEFVQDISYELFEYLHKTCGFLLTFLVLIHISLNWQWIKITFFKKNKV